MSRRLLILTPDASGAWGGSRWPDVLDEMRAPLVAAGHTVSHCAWTDTGDLAGYDLVMPLLAWGYHRDGDWQAQVGAWEEASAQLMNPAPVLRWNADKLYLRRLDAAGAAIVPTIFADRIDKTALLAAADTFGTGRLVAKPRISAGAFQTIRWSPGTPLEGAPDSAAIIQPYLPSIESAGELSLIYLGGRFSHAIRKVPQPGDFRVQPEYDGIITPQAPAPDEIAVAEAALNAADATLLYARIDLVRDLDGKPAVMELELVEPDLYLRFDAEAPARFAQACAAIS